MDFSSLHLLLEKLNVAHFKVDSSRCISYSNHAMAELLGYDGVEDFIGTPTADLWSDLEVRKRMLTALQEENKILQWEVVVHKKDRSLIDISCSIMASYNEKGEVAGFEGIFLDVTDQKILRNDLEYSKEKFSKIFQLMPYTIVLSRLSDGIILDVNQGFEDGSGFKKNEIIGKKTTDLNLWSKEEDRDEMVRELKEKGEIINKEFEYTLKNGVTGTGLFSARRLDLQSEPCLIFITQDFTERKNMEIELQESHNKLSLYAFKNAHEVRGPLSRIISLSNVLPKLDNEEDRLLTLEYLKTSALELDQIVREMNAILSKTMSVNGYQLSTRGAAN